MTLHLRPPRPEGICLACHRTWLCTRPRPAVLYCHHFGTAARLTAAAQWRVLHAVSREEVAELRRMAHEQEVRS
jgi:hypothetical protein